MRPSMGSVGDAYDNAMCESFFATLECELLDRHRFRNPSEARRAVFDFIEGFYNRRRRHSALSLRVTGPLRAAGGVGPTPSSSCLTTTPARPPSHRASRATRLKGAGGRCPPETPGCKETYKTLKSLKRETEAPSLSGIPLWKIRDFPQREPFC